MKGMEFKLMLGVLMVVVLAAILLSFAFNAKEALANIDKVAPWLHLGDGGGGGGGGGAGATTTTTIPQSYFSNSPIWKSGDLSISSSLKWAAQDASKEAGCKSIIERLFNPAAGDFKTFIDACKYGDNDFKSGPFVLTQDCKVEANSLMNYIYSDSACRAQVGTSGFDQSIWLLPTKKCGEFHRDTFDKIRYNCGLDNTCSGKIWLYYDKNQKGIGICDENLDVPIAKDTDTARNIIIGWIDNMISDSERPRTCRIFDSDCTMIINVPEPGLHVLDLIPKIKDTVVIDMGISGAFNDGAKELEYGNGKHPCSWWDVPCLTGLTNPGYIRNGVGMIFSFEDPKPMSSDGVAAPCASPKSDYIAYNCGSDVVCKGDIRVTYGCDGTDCGKTNTNRFLGVCEKP